MDHIDRQILRELKRDARQPNLRLAERVGLSPSACLRRVQELERSGVIKGYRVAIDGARLGTGLITYITIGILEHNTENLKAFERAVARCPEITECHKIAGAIEYLLRVEVADIQAYKAFHTDVLGVLPHVREIISYIVLDSPKDERS